MNSRVSTPPKISVVLPVFKTATFLRELHERLVKTLAPAGDFELLMIDDGSPDGAWEILQEIASRDSRVKALRLSRNFGQHPAIAAGFDRARGETIVLMDADLQDRPEDIPLLLERLRDPVEIVFTTKRGETEPFLTRLTSHLFHFTFSRITGTNVPRSIGTFRAFSRRVLEALRSFPERHVLWGPLMFQIGFESATVEVPHEKRRSGRSAYSFATRLALALESLLTNTDVPHRFLVRFGGLVVGGCALYSVALVGRWLWSHENVPPGLTLLALLITFSLGSVSLSLGIVGTYVFRVYQEVLKRPRYIVARALNLDESLESPPCPEPTTRANAS
jgi:dolichol-phosphate mannosyltransferase